MFKNQNNIFPWIQNIIRFWFYALLQVMFHISQVSVLNILLALVTSRDEKERKKMVFFLLNRNESTLNHQCIDKISIFGHVHHDTISFIYHSSLFCQIAFSDKYHHLVKYVTKIANRTGTERGKLVKHMAGSQAHYYNIFIVPLFQSRCANRYVL